MSLAEKIDLSSLDALPPIPDLVGCARSVVYCAMLDVSFWDDAIKIASGNARQSKRACAAS